MSTANAEYWTRHYTGRHNSAELSAGARLDFSNERVQFQTYGLILEAAGPIPGKRCLDAGCGLGDIARLLSFLGGRVSGCDLVEATMARLRAEHPEIHWFAADLENIPATEVPDPFDLVVACEVLQYVSLTRAVNSLWRLVAPGGRLVGVAPHAACPIVRRAQERFENNYHGASLEELAAVAGQLPGLVNWCWRGAYFQDDQSVVPYGLTAWSQEMSWGDVKTPNRLQFVMLRELAAEKRD
jgi:2-polyprenyl-3-methyl-5-hydroxy-6-metoxy-1,4-benzoquinol methylase